MDGSPLRGEVSHLRVDHAARASATSEGRVVAKQARPACLSRPVAVLVRMSKARSRRFEAITDLSAPAAGDCTARASANGVTIGKCARP